MQVAAVSTDGRIMRSAIGAAKIANALGIGRARVCRVLEAFDLATELERQSLDVQSDIGLAQWQFASRWPPERFATTTEAGSRRPCA